ncbi:MAG: hypothetical protein HY899_15600 [Deltaproteobacteria bacterium]|nr:hypothetical protein [Deltaproteobacteria bacterium]
MLVRRMFGNRLDGGAAALNELLRLRPRAGVATVLRIALSVTVIAYLAHRIAQLGWEQVGSSLPRSPWFYAISLILYLLLPLSEVINYQLILRTALWSSFSVLLRKRVYNFAVFGYCGEAYFILWLRRHLRLADRKAVSAVKDNNVLSAMVSNGAAVLLSAALLISGRLEPLLGAVPGVAAYAGGCALAAIVCVPVMARFHRSILAIPATTAAAVAATHTLRVVVVQALLAVQWSIALPQVPLQTWLVLLAAQMLLTRVPFLPNQDLVVLGLGLSLADTVAAPAAAVAGMFVAAGALTQCLHLGVYALTSLDRSVRFGPAVPARAA